ncbi:MAG: dNTP triphosphohydrolase [Ignavibacteriaceae bacterium]|nr:dNTP triphosphohydrolase [Ignavibacteriaceae bacterium]
MNWKNLLNENRLRPSSRDKSDDFRNEFESDNGRIIFSPAVRRMHDKTQVFPLTNDDNIHSRLTHSLEVMSVGESIALNILNNQKFKNISGLDQSHYLRQIPVIVKNACLVHDIGNPPFGHFGEAVIQGYFKNLFMHDRENEEKNLNPKFEISNLERQDFEYFDGNAQGLRVLTKLQVLDDSFGLNLTYATLGAYIKYPNFDELISDKSSVEYLTRKKRGIFQSEKEYFKTIASNLGIESNQKYLRHPLAYIVEAADSICYLIMDIEDGYNKGWYNYDYIKDVLSKNKPLKDLFEKIDKASKSEISNIVNLRHGLIKYFVVLSVNNFINNYDSIMNGAYLKELIKDDENEVAKELSNYCTSKIFSNREITSLELTGHSVIKGLLDYFIDFTFSTNCAYRKRAVGLISKSIKKAAILETGKDSFEELSSYYKLRVIVDFISGMTDQFALNQFRKISGQKII